MGVPRVCEAIRVTVSFATGSEDGVDAGVNGHNQDGLVRESKLSYLIGQTKAEIFSRMQRGYEEMARINLRIAVESFFVEQEAGGTVERLVSGV